MVETVFLHLFRWRGDQNVRSLMCQTLYRTLQVDPVNYHMQQDSVAFFFF